MTSCSGSPDHHADVGGEAELVDLGAVHGDVVAGLGEMAQRGEAGDDGVVVPAGATSGC